MISRVSSWTVPASWEFTEKWHVTDKGTSWKMKENVKKMVRAVGGVQYSQWDKCLHSYMRHWSLEWCWGKHSTLLNGSVLLGQCVFVYAKGHTLTQATYYVKVALSVCLWGGLQDLWSQGLTLLAVTFDLWTHMRRCETSLSVQGVSSGHRIISNIVTWSDIWQ